MRAPWMVTGWMKAARLGAFTQHRKFVVVAASRHTTRYATRGTAVLPLGTSGSMQIHIEFDCRLSVNKASCTVERTRLVGRSLAVR